MTGSMAALHQISSGFGHGVDAMKNWSRAGESIDSFFLHHYSFFFQSLLLLTLELPFALPRLSCAGGPLRAAAMMA